MIGDKERYEQAEEWVRETGSWPEYFVSGEMDDPPDNWVPAYYRVEGPNGPVSYMNPNTGPYPTTMWNLVMEAQSDHFEWCEEDDTPYADLRETI